MKLILITLVFCTLACGDSSGPKLITLPLTSVDAKALPTTLPSSNGTVQVVVGRLVGSPTGPACSWYLTFSPGGESSGSIGDCTVSAGDVITLTFDLNGPPVGSHNYRFGQ